MSCIVRPRDCVVETRPNPMNVRDLVLSKMVWVQSTEYSV